MAPAGQIRTGTAGWVFEPWRGAFYPPRLVQKRELAYASSRLRVIEINATFYANQKLSSFANWADQSAQNFVFSVKGPKFITHQLKLRNAAGPLANFMASGVLRLGPKLGPFIWQLPGNLHYDRDRLESFFALLPHTPADAARLADAHDERVKDAYAATDGVAAFRHAIEVRHESYANAEFVDLLRQYDVALVCADTADWPYFDVTADFVYGRLQGPPSGGGYGAQDLDRIAARADAWSKGAVANDDAFLTDAVRDGKPRDVFLFFVHEDKLHAPANAMAVMQRLGIKAPGD